MSSPLRLPLILSLSVNLLLVGLAAGHFLLGPPPPPPPPQHEQSLDAVEEVARQLPEEKAALLRDAMDRAKLDVEAQKKSMSKIRGRTTEVLSAEEFDPQAYQEAVEQLHELRGAMMQRMSEGTMEAAASLNRQERTLLAETFRRYHGYWKKCSAEEPKQPPGR